MANGAKPSSAADLAARWNAQNAADQTAVQGVQGALGIEPVTTTTVPPTTVPTTTTTTMPPAAGVPGPATPDAAQPQPESGVRPSFLAQETTEGMLGLGKVVGGAMDAADWLIKEGLGRIHPYFAEGGRPFLGGEHIQELTDWYVTGGNQWSKMKAKNTMEYIAGRAFEELGLALPITGWLYNKAGQIAARAPDGTSALQRLAKDVASIPAKDLLALEAGTSLTAGGVGGAVGHALDSETADTVATVVTALGVTGGMSMISRATQLVKTRGFGRIKTEGEINTIAGKILGDMDDESLSQAVKMADYFRGLGVDESLIPNIGALSGDPNLTQLARQFTTDSEVSLARAAEEMDNYLRLKLDEIPGIPRDADIGAVRRAVILDQHRQAALKGERVAAAYKDPELNAILEGERIILDVTGAESLDDALRRLTDAAQKRAAAAVEDLESTLIDLDPGSPGFRSAAGEAISREFDAEMDTLRDAVRPVYDNIMARYKGYIVDADDVTAEAQRIAGEIDSIGTAPDDIPAVVREIVGKEAWVSGRVPLEELVLLRRRLQDGLRGLSGQAPNPALRRNLRTMLKHTDEAIDQAGSSADIPSLAEVNRFYRTGMERLHRARAAAVQRSGPLGETTRMDLGQIGMRFLRADSNEAALDAANQFRRAFGGQEGIPEARPPDSPELAGLRQQLADIDAGPQTTATARTKKGLEHKVKRLEAEAEPVPGIEAIPANVAAEQAMDDLVISEMVHASRVGGVIDPIRAQKFIDTHQEVLSVRPELKARLESVKGRKEAADDFIRRVDERAEQIKARAKEVGISEEQRIKALEDSAFYRTRHRMAGAEMEVILKMDDVEKSLYMTELVAQIRALPVAEGLPAMNALRRQFYDKVTGGLFSSERGIRGKGRLLDENAMREVFEKHGDVVRALYGEETAVEQRLFINALADAVGVRGRMTNIPKSLRGSPMEEMFGEIVSRLSSRVYAWKRGVVSFRYLATEQALRVFSRHTARMNTEAIHKTLADAMYDPQKAKRLVDLARAPTPGIMEKRLLALPVFLSEISQDEVPGQLGTAISGAHGAWRRGEVGMPTR